MLVIVVKSLNFADSDTICISLALSSGLHTQMPFLAGTIYCSPITARLVQQRLKVPARFLHVVALHSPFQVAGVTVTFVDAHHCPGAVMILFEAPGKLPLLHTGDCR